MNCKYNEVALGDVCIFGDGAHTKVKRVESGVPYLTSKNIKNGYISIENVDYISEESYEKLFGKSQKSVRHLQEGDVLIGIIGTFGNCYKYKGNDKFGISSSIAIVRPDVQKIDSDYLYHYLSSKRFKNYTEIFKGGSVQGYTNLPTLRKIPIYLPNIDIQKRIANILSALDKKIELNNKMNKTLEEMAQALFKRWFVDFEFPNEDGESYKSSGGEMVESEFGIIPVGWRYGTIQETSNKIFSGGTPKTSEETYWNGKLYWMSSGETRNNFIVSTEKSITDLGAQKSSTRLANKYDTVIASAGQGFTRGQTSMLLIDTYINQSLIAINSNQYFRIFNYINIKMRYNELRSISDSHSIRGSLTTKMIAALNTIIPTNEILIKFNELINPIICNIENNINNSDDLTKLRDLLLPKLMSGEIRVEDIETNLIND